LKESIREKIHKARQEMLNLLNESKWDLIEEKYSEANEKIDEIQKLFVELLADLMQLAKSDT
jgi:hypothetical protein